MIKKTIKCIFQINMIVLLLFSYMIKPLNVYAAKDPETLGDLKNELADLKKQKSENDADKKSTQNKIKEKERAISNAELAINQAETDINNAQQEIESSNERIEGLKKQTENIMKLMQQLQDNNVYMDYISGASSITDMLMRLEAIEQITSSNQKNLEELEALIKRNEQLKIDLAKKQENLEAKIKEYHEAIKSLNIDLESYDKFALDIDTQIKVAQQRVDEYSKLCKASSKSYLGDAELLTDCVDVPYNAGWLKPLNKGRVTSPFGWRYSPITQSYYEYHSGIDIGGNAEGTNVYAAASGVVAGIVERYRCGGNMVYINVNVGGKNYITYYYHLLRINVKVGQVVTQNTIIGTVGGYSTSTSHGGYDKCTTGAHLHFGVATGTFNVKLGTVPKAQQITPPGFNNVKGYSFSSRTAYYG